MPTQQAEQLITADQLAALLGATPAYIRKRTRQRTIPAVNLRAACPGGDRRPMWRYDAVAVRAHLDRLGGAW